VVHIAFSEYRLALWRIRGERPGDSASGTATATPWPSPKPWKGTKEAGSDGNVPEDDPHPAHLQRGEGIEIKLPPA
jgi:hypothetical protein